MAPHARPTHRRSSSRVFRRVALLALAAAISLATVAESMAQARGPGGGPIGGPFNTIPLVPIGPGPFVGGGPVGGGPTFRPRLSPEIDQIPIVRPYGPVVIDNLDNYRNWLITRGPRPMRQIRQAQQPRPGFNVPPAGETRFVPDEVILTIGANVSDALLDTIARQHRLTRIESQELSLTGRKLFRWRISDGRTVPTAIRGLRVDGRIIAAQPNYLYTLAGDKPGEDNVAPAEGDPSQYALTKLRLPQAHQIAKGDSVLVAVIDTPIDAAHPELAGVIANTFEAAGANEKPRAHGTAMASAIAAHGKLMGAAPSVKLLSVQAFGSARPEGTGFNILKGVEWAAREKANVINMSFAGPPDPALREVLSAANARGIVLIAAAGNAGPRSRPLFPAADPNVIAVTATDPQDRLYPLANRGSHIAVAAPGVDILVAAPEGGYDVTSGTSVAAAEVSGVVALMFERERKLDPASVRRLLMGTARDLGPAGTDDQFGAGLVDALGAVTAITKPTASSGRGNAAR